MIQYVDSTVCVYVRMCVRTYVYMITCLPAYEWLQLRQGYVYLLLVGALKWPSGSGIATYQKYDIIVHM